jgi:hypothetical protein
MTPFGIVKEPGGKPLRRDSHPECGKCLRVMAERNQLRQDAERLMAENSDLASRLAAAVSALRGLYEWQRGFEELLPNILIAEVQAVLNEENDDGWTTLGELRAGAVFEDEAGVRAVKTCHSSIGPPRECEFICYLLSSGDCAHFPEKNRTRVREIPVGEPEPEEGA